MTGRDVPFPHDRGSKDPVATDLTPQTDPADVRVPARRHHRRALILLALAAFQFWMWGTRIVNLVGETGDVTTAFVAVHLALFTTGIGAGVILAVIGVRMWLEARRGGR